MKTSSSRFLLRSRVAARGLRSAHKSVAAGAAGLTTLLLVGCSSGTEGARTTSQASTVSQADTGNVLSV